MNDYVTYCSECCEEIILIIKANVMEELIYFSIIAIDNKGNDFVIFVLILCSHDNIDEN